MKQICILGSTGSIGRNTLRIVDMFPGRFRVRALAAKTNVALLSEQIGRFKPDIAVVFDEKRARELRRRIPAGAGVQILHGAEGYRAVKYHVMGESPNEVVETARQIRGFIGKDTLLMIDAHKVWDPWVAIDTARRLEDHNGFWLEEPVLWDDQVGGMALLASKTRIGIAAGESETSRYVCRDPCAHAGIRFLQTDILSSGGYTAWLKLAAVAYAFQVKISPHGASFPELAAPLVAAVPNGFSVSAFPAGDTGELWSKLYKEPSILKGGAIHLQDRPGLGLEFDDRFVIPAAHRM